MRILNGSLVAYCLIGYSIGCIASGWYLGLTAGETLSDILRAILLGAYLYFVVGDKAQ